MSLRALAEKDLGKTLEGADWGSPVYLVGPDGIRYTETADGRPLTGQVLYNVVRTDPETGERITADTPVVSLRRSSLTRIPVAGESWIVGAPESPLADASMRQFVFSSTRPPEGGAALGFIRLYLQAVEQAPAEEPTIGDEVAAALAEAQTP